MTDTEKAALEARIDELCAEVERLRNQLRDQQDTAEHNFVRNAREYKRVCDENERLRSCLSDGADNAREIMGENARLRKLVRDMWDFYCVVPDEPHASKEEIDFSVEVWRRMRELGVDE